MAVLRESPWYQEILREGETRGEALGEARGRREELLSNIEISLDAKFGSDGLQLMPQIAEIPDLERLKTIFRNAIAATTIEEFRQLI